MQCTMPLAGLSLMQMHSVHIHSNRIVLQAAPQPICLGTHTGKAPPPPKLPSNVRIKVNHGSKLKQH